MAGAPARDREAQASLRDLNDKIEEAKRKKNLLLARQRRAQAQKRIAETMSSISEKSAFEAFARMEENIEQNERQIKASAEIDEEFSGDRLQQDFKQLEKVARFGERRHAAHGAQAENGHAAAGAVGREQADRRGRQRVTPRRVHAEIEDDDRREETR